jgi:hypothetical protein
LLANDRKRLCFRRERKLLLELISIAKKLINEKKLQRLQLKNQPIYRYRTFSTPTNPCLSSSRPRQSAAVQSVHSSTSKISVPKEITMDNIEDVFEDLTEYVMIENNKELNLKLPNTIVAMKS